MLTIREEQYAVLAAASREEFLCRMERHLRGHFRPFLEPLTKEQLREVIERNWKRAEDYGLTSEFGVCCYLEAVAALGEDALAVESVARRLRDQEHMEMDKCELLNDCVLSAWEVNQP